MLGKPLERRSGLAAFIIGVALGLAACATVSDKARTAGATDTITVRTTAGLVRGMVSSDGSVEVFKGIPFAAPPVGELRWKAPRPPVAWSDVRDAFDAASPCPQTGRLASTNEDCLYLNV